MDFTQDYVQANDLQVFYHRSQNGRSQPPLLLLHGYTDNGLCWSRVADDLQDRYDVIMPDARGHGRTQGSIEDFSYQQLGEDALAIIEALGLERPFLFGHSMGALTALIVAAQAPQRVRALVLEDPPFMSEQRGAPVDMEAIQKMIADNLALQKRPLAERVAACHSNDPGWSDEEVIPWAESKGEYNPEIQALAVRRRMHQYPWREVAPGVECPVLLVTAERGIISTETAVEATRLIPNCKTIRMSAAGHCIHRDAYQETMEPIATFLAEH